MKFSLINSKFGWGHACRDSVHLIYQDIPRVYHRAWHTACAQKYFLINQSLQHLILYDFLDCEALQLKLSYITTPPRKLAVVLAMCFYFSRFLSFLIYSDHSQKDIKL